VLHYIWEVEYNQQTGKMQCILKSQRCFLIPMKQTFNHFHTTKSCDGLSRFLPNLIRRRNFPSVSVINLFGMISAQSGGSRFGRSKYLNLESLDSTIEKAFAVKNLKTVCLLINSPGGSAVQSELIANKIIRLGQKKKVKVVSFVEDVAASGGYWLSLAGSEIYVAQNSVVGSVGVISASFGLEEFINRYGIERRVYTAGNNKSIMDPFSPEKENDVKKIKLLLGKIHNNFIQHVKENRGNRLRKDDEFLFNGDFWIGKDAADYGLVDGINDVDNYIRENFGKDVKVKRVNRQKQGGLGSIFGTESLNLEEILVRNRFPMLK